MSRDFSAHFFMSTKKRAFLLRNISLDLMKLALALMVVGIHTSFFADISQVVSYLLNQGLFRIAVPIFFVVNGYYFFVSLQSEKAKAWVIRIVILYLVWTFAYIFYWFDLGDASIIDFAKLIHTVIFGYFHLWYLPAVIGAAGLVYFFKTLPVRVFIIFLFVAFTCGISIQYLGNYHLIKAPYIDKILNMGWVYRNFIFSGFPFFGIGYLLARHMVESKLSLSQVTLASGVGVIFVFSEAYVNYILIGTVESFDLLMSLVIAVPLIFILFKKINIIGHGRTLSLYASGIYFIHPLLMHIIWGYGLRATQLTLTVILFSLLATMVLIFINKKLKFIL